MESNTAVIARIRTAGENLTRYASAYRALEHPAFDAVYPLIMGYIRDRFLLTREMCRSEKLLDLADVSLRFLLELKRRGIDAGEIARSCSGASSVIAKKVLLMKAVQEDFGVSMTPAEFAEISTVSELAEFLCRRSPSVAAGKPAPAGQAPDRSFDAETLRRDYPALSETIHGHRLVYLDNAATAQCPGAVLDAVREAEACRGNVHRGVHTLSDRATERYEQARRVCADFLHARPGQITFTAGTTDGINRVAAAWSGGVVTTALEHHSNFVPWQQMCLREQRPFRVCPILPDGTLDLEALDRLLDGSVSLLAVTGCSNVLGTVPPLEQIIPLAHSRGVKVLVDAAQAVCHMDMDVTELDCDYFVCSGHKLGGPFGIGLLYCREPLAPRVFGGGMVDRVTEQETTFLPTLEAGTPNLSGAVGLAAALTYRRSLPSGWQEYERMLLWRGRTLLSEIPGLRVLGPENAVGCFSFVPEGISALEAAALLDQLGIALRSGDHCAQILHQALGTPYTLRVSPAFYNTPEEMDALADGLRQVLLAAEKDRGK